jgi:hypothetical protein
MKIVLITLGVILGLFIIFQIVITMSTAKTEIQAYKVIEKDEDFEIRYYPATTMAKVTSNIKTYKDLGHSGFGTLAKYIFGGNSEKKQIAMTSPVHMEISDSVSSMSFVMPSKFNKDNLPSPDNANVVIERVEAEYVAVISFGGFANETDINENKALLSAALKKKGITYHGNFRFLGYNPPYQLFGRRNEVIVSVEGVFKL